MEELIQEFYKAFANKDAEKMVSCYHDDVEFTDPAFGTLKGERAKNMWRMLLSNNNEINVVSSNIVANGDSTTAHWEATYVFSQTGRTVLNKIDATFTFKEGKIIQHIDVFDLHKWAKQALGFKGLVLGGTSFFKRKLNAQTGRLLDAFEAKQANS